MQAIAHYTAKIRFMSEDKRGYNFFIDVLMKRINNDSAPIPYFHYKNKDKKLHILYKRRNIIVYIWWINLLLLMSFVLCLPPLFPEHFEFFRRNR